MVIFLPHIPVSRGCEDHSLQMVLCMSSGHIGALGSDRDDAKSAVRLLQQTTFKMVSLRTLE